MPPTTSPSDPKSTVPIEAVLFDFGMVLCHPPNQAVWAQMRTIAALSEEAFHREYWAHRHPYDRGTHTGQEYWQLVASRNNTLFTPDQIAQLIAADTALWTDPNDAMIAWAAQLQRAGIRTGILSNIGDAMEAGVRAKFDWLRNFDHCTWSHNLSLAKPELEIYRHAAQGLATDPARILFIDDRIENIQAAHDVGMQAIQYRDHTQFLADMEAQGFGALLHPEVR
jgi:putative hydrolase of the HAD superfamily